MVPVGGRGNLEQPENRLDSEPLSSRRHYASALASILFLLGHLPCRVSVVQPIFGAIDSIVAQYEGLASGLQHQPHRLLRRLLHAASICWNFRASSNSGTIHKPPYLQARAAGKPMLFG